MPIEAGQARPDASPLEAPAPPEAAVSADPDPSSLLEDERPPASPDATQRHPLSTAEPRRVTLRRLEDDRALLRHRDLLRAHFGAALAAPLELQIADALGDRRAILVSGGPKDRNPIILVLDADQKVLWTKERPLAGIAPGVKEVALLPGPDGQVTISWFDAPTRLLALRAWDARGGILADFQLLEIEACDALSGLYWPGQGFLVVAAQAGGAARAQLLDEGGKLAWGLGGRAVPWVSRAGAPVAIAVDTHRSVVILQLGELPRAARPAGPEHALAVRFDAQGAALWDRPVDLGPAPLSAGGRTGERILARRADEGFVRVSLPWAPRRDVEVSAVGVVSAPRLR
jgi:hypothetical protein